MTTRIDKGTTQLDLLLARYASSVDDGWRGRILTAIVLTGIFVGVRFAMAPIMGLTFGLSLLLPAILLAAMASGFRTALLTTLLCSAIMAWLMPHFVGQPIPLLPPMIAFWMVALICALVGASLRNTIHRLQTVHENLVRVNEQQRTSANEMRAMVDQASAGIIRTDMQGNILDANTRFAQILDRPVEDIIGHNVTEFTHADDIHLSQDAIENLNNGQSGFHMDKRYTRANGDVAHVLVSIRTLRHDDTSAPYGLISVIVDMSAVRHAENALNESRHSFRVVADSIAVMIWLTSDDKSDMHVQKGENFVNRAYLEFTGQTFSASTPLDWVERLHPDDHDRIIALFREGTASDLPFTMEARYRRYDGQWRWLKSFHQPRLDRQGQKIGIVGTAFDVTETREAANRIEESEARFRTVANSAPAMIWMVDDQGRTVFGNRRFQSVFSGNMPPRLTTAWREMVPPEDRDSLDRIMADAQNNQRRFSMLSRINHPQFGERWIRTEAAPRHNLAGQLEGYTGVSLDVTESQQAERDLKRINELLEERVTAALEEKAKAEAELVRSNRLEAVGRLTGGVAHDFNNLLTVIMGGLDMILRTDDPARRRKIGEAALAAARRGERLTSQLLAFSRRQTLSPALTDINALIREGEPLLHKAVGNGMELTFALSNDIAPTLVDPAKFEAALINLLVNARDASPNQGRVIVETAPYSVPPAPSVSVSKNPPPPPELVEGQYVRVTVTDNGSGMSEDTQRRVFEPFFTTKGVGRGTGLGLSQVYGFTRQSGGAVSVQSTPGQGTSVHLFLPWSSLRTIEDLNKSLPSVADPSSTVSQRLRILVVEDDHDVATILTSLLHAEGHIVVRVENAEQALNRLESHTYDLVISDILMPGGMNGIDLAHILRDKWPNLPVILSSGYPGEVEALKNTPWTFLPKPYTAAQLRAVLTGL